MSYFMNLTAEEMTRMQPCTKAKCVITSSDSRMESFAEIADGILPDGHIKNLTVPSSSGYIPSADVLDNAEEIAVQPPSSIDKNGHNNYNNKNNFKAEKLDKDERNDNEGCVKCIYITQQCCECVIL